MPGVIGGIVGAITAAWAKAETYGYDGMYNIWSGMAPKTNSTEYFRLKNLGLTDLKGGDGFTAKEMGGYQIAALFVALGFALVGGILTGFIIKLEIFNPPKEHQLYDDN